MEHWRIAPGTHAMVSTEGRVWDHAFLEPWLDEDDNEVLVLVGGRVRVLAHLVLLAFDRRRPAGCEAHHKDGDTAHNALANLEWMRVRPDRRPPLQLVQQKNARVGGFPRPPGAAVAGGAPGRGRWRPA